MKHQSNKKYLNLFSILIIIIILFVIIINLNVFSRKKEIYNDNKIYKVSKVENFIKIATQAYNEIYGEKIVNINDEEINVSLTELYTKLVDPNGEYKQNIVKREINDIENIIPSSSIVNLVSGMDGRDKTSVSIDTSNKSFAYYAEINGKYYQMELNDSKISLGEELSNLPENEIFELKAVSNDENLVKAYVNDDIVVIEACSNVNGNTTIDLEYKSLKTSINVNVKPSYLVKFDTTGGSYITSQIVAFEEFVTRPINPQKDGYIFENWYLDEGLTTEYDFDSVVNSNMVIYAKFKNIE